METPLITPTVNIVPRFYLQQGWPIVPCERSRIPSCRQKKRLLTQATPIIAQNRELGFPAATVSDLKTSLLTTKFFEDCPATSLREVLLQGGLNQGTWRINQSKRFSQVFLQTEIQVFYYATVENFKTVWAYLTSQETALEFTNAIGLFAKKLENLLFWLDNVFPSARVQVVSL